MAKDTEMMRQAHAADWLQRLERGDVSDNELLEFQAWLSESDENRIAFRSAQDVWNATAVSEENLQKVLDLQSSQDLKRGAIWGASFQNSMFRRASFRLAASAFCGILVVSLAFILTRPDPVVEFEFAETVIGASETIEFNDGSEVQLNTATKIAHRYTTSERVVELIDGEAFFVVEPLSTAPFLVNAGAHQIRVIGTEFNVKYLQDNLSVMVVEGTVDLSLGGVAQSKRLLAGDALVISPDGRISERQLNSAIDLAWRKGAFAFENLSLAKILDDLDRYFEQDLSYSGAVGPGVYSGIIFLDDLPIALEQLSALSGVNISYQAGSGVLVE